MLGIFLTLLAGMSTGIGAFIAFFTKRTDTKFLSAALGFSAGVMIYVSFMDLLPIANQYLSTSLGAQLGTWAAFASFFGAIIIIAIIDRLVPEFENPHEAHKAEDIQSIRPSQFHHNPLYRTGLWIAIVISLHNFPEGLATFAATLANPALGIGIAIAIAIHNIPEGIAVSIPFYCATGDKKKAFTLAFLSGLAEPLGAILGYLFLMQFMNAAIFGAFFAIVAGIMMFISLDELMPAAQRFGHHHHAVYGIIAGMAVMALSMLLIS